jgi:hypothetical protein
VSQLLLAILFALVAAASVGPRPAVADAGEALTSAAQLVQQARSTESEPERARLVADALAALDTEPGLMGWTWLQEPLQANPPELARAQEKLTAAATAIRVRPTTTTDAARARGLLADVLADPRFQERDWQSYVPGWLLPALLVVQAIVQVLWDIARWPFDRGLDLLGFALRSPLMILIGLAAGVGIIALYRFALRATLVRQAEIAPEHEPLPPTAGEALAAAHRAATVGHYRNACHFVLLSTLLWIEEQGDARFDPAATNREHLRRAQAAARPAVARALGPLVAAFDHLWYGSGDITEADYRRLLELAAQVREVPA